MGAIAERQWIETEPAESGLRGRGLTATDRDGNGVILAPDRRVDGTSGSDEVAGRGHRDPGMG